MDRSKFAIRFGVASIGSFLFLLSLSGFVGCGKSGSPTPGDVPKGDAVAGPSQSAVQTTNPGGAVHLYLEAVRTGDAAQVNNLLSTVARQKTAEMNISVAPPGSDTASFEVGQVKYLSDAKQAAHVESRWTELDETGTPETHAITWILRQEAAGWRVAGMMGQFVEGQDVMVFNFENPQEVIRQRDASEELIRQREEAYQAEAVDEDGTARR